MIFYRTLMMEEIRLKKLSKLPKDIWWLLDNKNTSISMNECAEIKIGILK